MVFLYILLLVLAKQVYSSPVATFSGPGYIKISLNQTHQHKFNLSFNSLLSYGLIFAVFDLSQQIVFRLYLENSYLLFDYANSGQTLEPIELQDTWTTILCSTNSGSLNISVNSSQYLREFPNDISLNLREVYIGGLDPMGTHLSYQQFAGQIRNTVFDELYPLFRSKNQRTNIVYQNVVIDDNPPPLNTANQTVTINRTHIQFPITATTFSNLSISFEFKSPETSLPLLSYRMKSYIFSLRKDINQLILELNMRGYEEKLVVDLISASDWISVKVVVNSEVASLSADDRNSEVKYVNRIPNRRFDKQPIFFGWDDKRGFRGCLRNVAVSNVYVPLYDIIAPYAGTFVGCWVPTPTCAELTCPYSCRQTWEQTTCLSVPTITEIAQFTGFSIIHVTVPSLLVEDTNNNEISIKLQFISTSTSTNDVLLKLERVKDSWTFLTLQMLEGYIMLSFLLNEMEIKFGTGSPLNDGRLHDIAIMINEDYVSFQVDERTESQSHQVNMTLYGHTTHVKIGGSSLKIYNHGFTGCLGKISINSVDMLALALSKRSNAVITDVILDECALIPESTITPNKPTSHIDQLTTQHASNMGFTTRSSGNTTYDVYTKDRHNRKTSLVPVIRSQSRQDEHLLIGLMLGVITVLAMFIFLLYYLWQKRQMHQAAKDRARKNMSDDLELDEFLNKTYNPKKQDKYTLFTPHALDVIEEESENDELLANLSVTL